MDNHPSEQANTTTAVETKGLDAVVFRSVDGKVYVNTSRHGVFSLAGGTPLQAAADMIERLFPNGSVAHWNTRPAAKSA